MALSDDNNDNDGDDDDDDVGDIQAIMNQKDSSSEDSSEGEGAEEHKVVEKDTPPKKIDSKSAEDQINNG